MVNETSKIQEMFITLLECGLITHDTEKVLSMTADDIIGIGMGSQGCVNGKEDVLRIIADGKVEKYPPEIIYDNIEIRCYENQFATICGVIRIRSLINGEMVESKLGQMMNLRKENGQWLIYTLQATPLFNGIEEMEAYPIKFAENVLEKYRQQEQIAKSVQNESVAIYHVNFTKDIFEDSVLKSDVMIRTSKGEVYERTMFDAGRRYLKEEEGYRFIGMFSLGNIFKSYSGGKTEISMEYEMSVPGDSRVWMKTIIKLYMDRNDESLKGYLYVVDINKEKCEALELKKNAETDSLTDLYNKKYTELKIEEKLKKISADNQGAFFMMDLDRFKGINDTYGHQEGDRILKETALHIKKLIRTGDIAGRLGGDEFCIFLCGELTEKMVAEKAEILCEGIRKILPDKENGTSCSIGIRICRTSDLTFKDIYLSADKALYEQKAKGRNGYTIYN